MIFEDPAEAVADPEGTARGALGTEAISAVYGDIEGETAMVAVEATESVRGRGSIGQCGYSGGGRQLLAGRRVKGDAHRKRVIGLHI